MQTYKYEVRDSGGGVNSGVIQATTLADATSRLRNEGYLLNLTPISDQAKGLLHRIQDLRIETGPGIKDIFSFTNQMAVMIKAGINIRGAISNIADHTDKAKFKRILLQIKEDVESGQPFSEALARHPKIFSPLYVNMVRASELSGNFGYMLERIASYLAQQVETRSMVRGAMVYPAIIAVMAVTTTIFLLTFVLPRFTKLFAGKESLLPKPTLMLIAISSFLRGYWYVVVAGGAAAGCAFFYAIRTEAGRLHWDRLKLRMPLLRRMFRALYITRGLQTMGELINAGVPMLETLRITARVSGNALYKDMWDSVHESVKEGSKVAAPLNQQNLLPGNVVQMIASGEESGKLGAVLQDISEYYSKELRNTIKAVTSMIEPLMIVLMGLVVGFIAMSIILPIFKMSSLVKS